MAAESTKVGGLNCTDVAFGGDRVIRKGVALRIEKQTHTQKSEPFNRKTHCLLFPAIYRVKIRPDQSMRLDSPMSQCLEIHLYECCSTIHINSAQLMASSEPVLDLQLIQDLKSLSNLMGPIENQNVSTTMFKARSFD